MVARFSAKSVGDCRAAEGNSKPCKPFSPTQYKFVPGVLRVKDPFLHPHIPYLACELFTLDNYVLITDTNRSS